MAPAAPMAAPVGTSPSLTAQTAAPHNAPLTARAANGPAFVRAGAEGHLSKTSSPSASAPKANAVFDERSHLRRGPHRRSPALLPALNSAGPVSDRSPVTNPIIAAETYTFEFFTVCAPVH